VAERERRAALAHEAPPPRRRLESTTRETHRYPSPAPTAWPRRCHSPAPSASEEIEELRERVRLQKCSTRESARGLGEVGVELRGVARANFAASSFAARPVVFPSLPLGDPL